jgi:D-xylulose reductase
MSPPASLSKSEQYRLDFAMKYSADVGIRSPKNDGSVEPSPSRKVSQSKVIQDHKLNHGVDIYVETSGAECCAQMAITILKAGGTCIQAGLGKQLIAVPLFLLTAKELNINGAHAGLLCRCD